MVVRSPFVKPKIVAEVPRQGRATAVPELLRRDLHGHPEQVLATEAVVVAIEEAAVSPERASVVAMGVVLAVVTEPLARRMVSMHLLRLPLKEEWTNRVAATRRRRRVRVASAIGTEREALAAVVVKSVVSRTT